MFPHTLSAQIALAVYFGGCLAILWLGGPHERMAGAAMIAIGVLQNLSHDHLHTGLQLWTAALDAALLVVFAGLAVASRKMWPLWATAFQLVATIVHGVKAVDPSVHGWAYLSATVLFGWFALAAVLVGSWLAFRERTAERASRL